MFFVSRQRLVHPRQIEAFFLPRVSDLSTHTLDVFVSETDLVFSQFVVQTLPL